MTVDPELELSEGSDVKPNVAGERRNLKAHAKLGHEARILGTPGKGIGWQATDALRLGFDYRFDRYVDREDKEPISQDDERHTFMLRATVDFEGLARLGN